jgi:transcriptional regulator with XRE-family HTH domain
LLSKTNPRTRQTMQTVNPIDMIVGGNVRLRRIQLGLEIASLAATLGITADRLQTMEAGRERVGASHLFEICRALKVAPGFFFEGPIADASGEVVLTYEI